MPGLTPSSPSYPPSKFAYLHWDAEAVGAVSFCNALIFLDLDALRPTQMTVAQIYGVDGRDAHAVRVVDRATREEPAPLARDNDDDGGGGGDVLLGLTRGGEYSVLLDDAAAVRRVRARTAIHRLLPRVGGEQQVMALSRAFYALVFAERSPLLRAGEAAEAEAVAEAEAHAAFRALFAAAAGDSATAARNQGEWFVELWGGGAQHGGATPYSDRFFGGATALTAGGADNGRRAVGRMLAKHTDGIMTDGRAARWLRYMSRAIDSTVPSAAARGDLRAYMLHFLAFFELRRPPLVAAVVAASSAARL